MAKHQMNQQPLSEDTANRIYDILVKHAGANDTPDLRQRFVHEFSKKPSPTDEYRFQGGLGFGGKFRIARYSVDCYPEDQTPAREEMIRNTNQALSELHNK